MEGEPPPVEGGPEQREEFAAEDAAEDADREEESRAAGDPSRGVGGDAAAGDDAMDVGMMLEVLAPGVEDGQEADLGPEVLGIGGDLLQGLGGGPEEQAVDDAGVLQGDRAERRREGEDEVEVLDGQEFGLAGLHPVGGGGGLALGAVAVAAGVVGDLPVAAPVALLDVAAQGGGPAGGDVMQDATLFVGESRRRSDRGRRRRVAGRRRRLRAGAGSWSRLSREGGEPVERAPGRLHGGRRDVGVDGGGLEVAVPEQDLDGADVGAGFEEVGGEAVAEGVDGDVLAQAGGCVRPGRRPGATALPVMGSPRDVAGEEPSVGRAAFQYSRSRSRSRGESMT